MSDSDLDLDAGELDDDTLAEPEVTHDEACTTETATPTHGPIRRGLQRPPTKRGLRMRKKARRHTAKHDSSDTAEVKLKTKRPRGRPRSKATVFNFWGL